MKITGARLYKVTLSAGNKGFIPQLLILTPNNGETRLNIGAILNQKVSKILKRSAFSQLVDPTVVKTEFVGTIDA